MSGADAARDDLIGALRDYWNEADAKQAPAPGCPNGPDEFGHYPCDPKGYFGVWECQTCSRLAAPRDGREICPHIDHGEFTLCEAERRRRDGRTASPATPKPK